MIFEIPYGKQAVTFDACNSYSAYYIWRCIWQTIKHIQNYASTANCFLHLKTSSPEMFAFSGIIMCSVNIGSYNCSSGRLLLLTPSACTLRNFNYNFGLSFHHSNGKYYNYRYNHVLRANTRIFCIIITVITIQTCCNRWHPWLCY
jgi:hypothetical protein